jgi:hypothetical protein
MTSLTIRFYPRGSTEPTTLLVPVDVVEIVIPAAEGQPQLKVNVNTDAVVLDTAEGERVAVWSYPEALAGAAGAGDW